VANEENGEENGNEKSGVHNAKQNLDARDHNSNDEKQSKA
jgi:hypothetical protein